MKQNEQLLEILRRNEDAISWTLTDLKGLDPSLCTLRIFLEDESRPFREAQRILNLKVWEVVKEEILKWLNVEIIYPISNSEWVILVHIVLKTARLTVTMIKTHLSIKWRVYIDYQKLNSAIKNYHFPLTFIDQILDQLARSCYFCFLDGYSATTRVQSILKIKRRRHSHDLLSHSPSNACHLDCAMPRNISMMYDSNLLRLSWRQLGSFCG